jgi:metallo-beta-lactamase class B
VVGAKLSVFTLVLFAISAPATAQRGSAVQADASIACADCDEWNAPHVPFRLFGNTYYVGVAGLSSVLITSDAGAILIDGGLPQSAPLIDANIRALGFRTQDIRLIVSSHEHYDHVAGIAALQRISGAMVAATAPAARALAQGGPTPEDPQSRSARFPAVKNVKVIADGEVLRVGPLAITAHHTPGHTPGATTWSWQSCVGSRCLDMVYADSLNPVSDEGFRFTSRPSTVDAFRKAIAKLEQLPCDVLVASHPSAVDLAGKLARWKKDPSTNPFIDPNACRAYAATARKRLDARLAEEQKSQR